eukprot:TRINITY_DN1355_c0_g1_i2.p1 TRINITY_DN1355_c0_g1~~TRINITY_DN1355_c0_g1_i2.p1  ORF type:complete len:193 (-),score=33.72 TRINITY_DN1355_c0_g1_i2:28-606(-)
MQPQANSHPYAITEEVICKICTNIYQDPAIIGACEHTFCKNCIKNLPKAKNLTVTCPLCQNAYRLPMNNANKLKRNTYLADLCKNINLNRKQMTNPFLESSNPYIAVNPFSTPDNAAPHDPFEEVQPVVHTPTGTGKNIYELFDKLGERSGEVEIVETPPGHIEGSGIYSSSGARDRPGKNLYRLMTNPYNK